MRSIVTRLTPASGRQDHTASPSVSDALVSRVKNVHRIPHPTSVTIAKRPSYRARDARKPARDLPVGLSEIFCEMALDSNSEKLPDGQIRFRFTEIMSSRGT